MLYSLVVVPTASPFPPNPHRSHTHAASPRTSAAVQRLTFSHPHCTRAPSPRTLASTSRPPARPSFALVRPSTSRTSRTYHARPKKDERDVVRTART
ncbi:hypothetical protein DFH09DRAFT_1365720 [Mycena vulgaris]|nr:hypothetical protein DFH09DRAFT_1365720 [Mycena vulgaris]